MTTLPPDAVVALVAELKGTNSEVSAEQLAEIPPDLALALGLFLVHLESAQAKTLVERVYDSIQGAPFHRASMYDRLARLAIALNRPEDAEIILQERLTRRRSITGLPLLARAYLRMGRQEEALRLTEQIVTDKEERLTAWTTRGEVLLATGDAPGAIQAYETALTCSADSPSARLGLAHCLMVTGENARARLLVSQALSFRIGKPSSWILQDALSIADQLGDQALSADLRKRLERLNSDTAKTLCERLVDIVLQLRLGHR